jgi:pimeloyl-ACP methyl ester carboxylesterase
MTKEYTKTKSACHNLGRKFFITNAFVAIVWLSCVRTSSAAPSAFTDEASFRAAASGIPITLESFEGLPNSAPSPYNLGNGITLFDSQGTITANTIFPLTITDGSRGWGLGGVFRPAGINDYPATIIFNPPVSAVGFDLGNALTLATLLTVSINGGPPILSLTAPPFRPINTVSFVGVVDRTGLISSLTISQNNAANGIGIDRLQFGRVVPSAPTGLTATVGDRAVYLNWASTSAPIDGYNIFAERFDDNTKQFIPLGTVNPPGILIRNTSFTVPAFANGDIVENGKLYRFAVQAVENGVVSGLSNPVLARPNEFAVGQIPARRDNPILFVHGINSDASTWHETTRFLESLGWTNGGEVLTNSFNPAGDFFTISFTDKLANYQTSICGTRCGILHQADELRSFIAALRNRGVLRPLSIVSHSMGGLAARSYMETYTSEAADRVFELLTYGSPHRGINLRAIREALNNFGNLACAICGLAVAFLSPMVLANSRGAADMDANCGGAPSAFLQGLRPGNLPAKRYTAIIGHNHELSSLLPERSDGCLAGPDGVTHTDGLVPTASADLSQTIPFPVRVIPTGTFHFDGVGSSHQTADFLPILCGLSSNCFITTVRSPVDIEIIAPDGQSITRQLAEIPGAAYSELEDQTGHPIATVIIPFPLPGEYQINVVPRDESSPTDTYTLDVTRDGKTTILAQDQRIQDIPSQPFIVGVPLLVNIDIKPGDSPNSINRRSQGKIPVAILSSSTFDAPARVNRLSLTFGHSGDETSLDFCNTQPADVNGDGLPDLVCHFNTQLTGFQVGDIEGVLKGEAIDGLFLRGTDSVRIVQ